MSTLGKLIDVTPEELSAVLDRVKQEQRTELAIVGPGIWLAHSPTDLPPMN